MLHNWDRDPVAASSMTSIYKAELMSTVLVTSTLVAWCHVFASHLSNKTAEDQHLGGPRFLPPPPMLSTAPYELPQKPA